MAKKETMTDLLRRWNAGEPRAFDAVMETAYEHLHQIARRQARGERRDHTLQPTAIFHEATLRLMDLDGLTWSDRTHFYAVAARMMRRILVDYAREQSRLKRGGGAIRVTLNPDASPAGDGPAADLEVLDAALTRLEERDPRQARVVELRFFGGLTGEEIAHSLDISTATVQREWRRARTWLYLELQGESLGG